MNANSDNLSHKHFIKTLICVYVERYSKWMPSRGVIVLVTQFILLGVTNALLEKAVYQQMAVGAPEFGAEPRRFRKPWFYNAVAFASMPTSFLLYQIYRCRDPMTHRRVSETPIKAFILLLLPAVFDIFQGLMASVTTIFVGVSVDKMLRGATIVFTALVSVARLGKTYSRFEWLGIAIIVVSLFIVGLAAVLNAGKGQFSFMSRKLTTLVLFLKLVSLAGYGFKLVVEEEVVTKRGVHHVLAVAMEGTWSTLLCCAVCLPALSLVRGEEGVGLREDTLDTFAMLSDNHVIIILLVAVFIVYSFYNNVSMDLTGQVSAVTRLVIDCGKTISLWVVQLVIYYSFMSNSKLSDFKDIGEPWKKYSWLQLTGFLLNIVGMAIYKGELTVPGLRYTRIDEYTLLTSGPSIEPGV